MPRYFFDTENNGTVFRDDEGFELAGDDEARFQALDALPDMARETMPNGDRRSFTSTVRDDAGRVIYRAVLSLTGHWEVGQEPNPLDPNAAAKKLSKPS